MSIGVEMMADVERDDDDSRRSISISFNSRSMLMAVVDLEGIEMRSRRVALR